MRKHLKQFFQCPDCKEIQVANQAYQNIVQQDYVRGARGEISIEMAFLLIASHPMEFSWMIDTYGTTILGVNLTSLDAPKRTLGKPLKNTWGSKELGPKSRTSSVWIHAYWMQLDQSRCRMDRGMISVRPVLLQVNKSDRPLEDLTFSKGEVCDIQDFIIGMEVFDNYFFRFDSQHSHTHTLNFVDPHWLNTASETEHT